MYLVSTYAASDYKVVVRHNESSVFFLHFDKEEIDDGEVVNAKEASVLVKNATYDKLVSAFIHVKYSADAELALVNNYITSPETHEAEFNEYQQWRRYCKDAARTIFPAEATPDAE